MGHNCATSYNIDSLKIFNRALELYEIQAFVSNSLGVIEPSFIHLGCQDCTFTTAKTKCISGFHMCTGIEYYSGVYQAIIIMGWNELDYNIFTADSKVKDETMKGLSVCCRDNDV